MRNLRETITDKMQQKHQIQKERREGFADDHDAVHAELERQLSNRNPRRAAGREQTPIRTGTRRMEEHLDSQNASQASDRSFDFSQTAIGRALGMLDSDTVSIDGSQEMSLGQAPESATSPDQASRLSLSLDDTQERQTSAEGGIVRQHGHEGLENVGNGNGV